MVSLDYINNLTYGVNDVSFDTPENRQAAQILQDWTNAGYFSDGFPGIGYDDSNNLFKAGNGAMTITGSWLAPELMVDTDQEFGFFLLPPYEGKTGLAIGGVGIPFAIRKTSEKQEIAAEYLNWMISPRAAELWAEAGMLPAMALPEDSKVDTKNLFGDTLNAWNTINQGNSVGHYIDWATPPSMTHWWLNCKSCLAAFQPQPISRKQLKRTTELTCSHNLNRGKDQRPVPEVPVFFIYPWRI